MFYSPIKRDILREVPSRQGGGLWLDEKAARVYSYLSLVQNPFSSLIAILMMLKVAAGQENV
jgi:hypothetical protein